MFGHLLAVKTADGEDIGFGVVSGVESLTDAYFLAAEVEEGRHDGHAGAVSNLPETAFPAAHRLAGAFGGDGDGKAAALGKLAHGGAHHIVVAVATVDADGTQSAQDGSQGPAEKLFLDKNRAVHVERPKVGRADEEIGHRGMGRHSEDAPLEFGAAAGGGKQEFPAAELHYSS